MATANFAVSGLRAPLKVMKKPFSQLSGPFFATAIPQPKITIYIVSRLVYFDDNDNVVVCKSYSFSRQMNTQPKYSQ